MAEDGERESAGPQSSDALFSLVYARLKAMAAAQLRRGPHPTLDTTELVHELYLRMSPNDLGFQHPAQFFAYAARAMRHLLMNRARDRLRLRAGGQWARITLDSHDAKLAVESAEQALALEDALTALEADDERAARVVELRYFAGMTLEDIAEQSGVSRRTVDRDWRYARAFIKTHLQ